MQLLQNRSLVFIALLLLAISISAAQWYQALHEPLNASTTIEVARGDHLGDIRIKLKEQAITEHADLFYWYVRLSGISRQLHAGEYQVSPKSNLIELAEKMVRGDVIDYQITIVEGSTTQDFIAAVKAHPMIKQTDVNYHSIMQTITGEDIHPEGQFFPDTYHFTKGTSDIELLKRAYSRMQEKLEQAWSTRADSIILTSPYEVLTLASIIEKETGQASERGQISGVFHRRLQRDMKLQTDPTVIYGMGEAYKGNIRRKDLRTPTPYNTYTQKGLPPSPICLPGYDSLLAAVNPEQGDTLYFVAKGNGEHVFSATLEDHNKAVRKYQLKK